MIQRIAVPPHMRVLAIERNNAWWRLWLHHDKQMHYGTYLKLYDSGRIERVTERPDEPCEIFLVKE